MSTLVLHECFAVCMHVILVLSFLWKNSKLATACIIIHADMPMERKTPAVYPDGSYQIVQENTRGNVILISNITQYGLTGQGSERRTAFFTFFG